MKEAVSVYRRHLIVFWSNGFCKNLSEQKIPMTLLQRKKKKSKLTMCFLGEWIIQKNQIVQNCFRKTCVCVSVCVWKGTCPYLFLYLTNWSYFILTLIIFSMKNLFTFLLCRKKNGIVFPSSIPREQNYHRRGSCLIIIKLKSCVLELKKKT